VAEALAGPGRPAGVASCELAERTVELTVDDAVTSPALVRLLAEIESRSAEAALPQDPATLARAAARGLGDPELDERRIIEWQVDER
jgi:hypothetical protein